MTGNVTSFDINFYLIYLPSYYLHHLDGATGLGRKTSYVALNICDSEGVFLLNDTYTTQVI